MIEFIIFLCAVAAYVLFVGTLEWLLIGIAKNWQIMHWVYSTPKNPSMVTHWKGCRWKKFRIGVLEKNRFCNTVIGIFNGYPLCCVRWYNYAVFDLGELPGFYSVWLFWKRNLDKKEPGVGYVQCPSCMDTTFLTRRYRRTLLGWLRPRPFSVYGQVD